MHIKLPLNEMTIEDKLRIMEDLWVDLTKVEEEYPSPSWHQDVLAARERKIKEGKEEYKDWEIAKKEIRSRLL